MFSTTIRQGVIITTVQKHVWWPLYYKNSFSAVGCSLLLLPLIYSCFILCTCPVYPNPPLPTCPCSESDQILQTPSSRSWTSRTGRRSASPRSHWSWSLCSLCWDGRRKGYRPSSPGWCAGIGIRKILRRFIVPCTTMYTRIIYMYYYSVCTLYKTYMYMYNWHTRLMYSTNPGGRVRCMSIVITMLSGFYNEKKEILTSSPYTCTYIAFLAEARSPHPQALHAAIYM